MSVLTIPISPLELNQLTRDYWGQWDPVVAAQLAAFANDRCYQIKFYKAPGDNQEVFAPNGFVSYGMRITPGSLIYGLHLPANVNLSNVLASKPNVFTLQVTDVTLQHRLFDEPISSLLIGNYKPEFQGSIAGASQGPAYIPMGSFPTLLPVPHPVVGSGLFDIEIQETANITQRIQVVFGVLEACGEA